MSAERDMTINIPGWVENLTLTRIGKGVWTATVSGDARGTGDPSFDIGHGDSPMQAADAAFDAGEGWTGFTLITSEEG